MRYLNKTELKISSRFLFLSMAMIVLKQDMNHIKNGDFKIKKPYLLLLEEMLKIATNERRQLRQIMKKHQLQVLCLRKSEWFTTFLFLSSQHEERRSYFNPRIQKNVENIMYGLLKKALNGESDARSNFARRLINL